MAYNRSKFPEEYDVFEEKFDLPPHKEPLADEWVTLQKKGGLRTQEEENRYIELTKELSVYLINPEDINYFQDAMTNVQKFFKEETQGYVDKLQSETKDFTNTKQDEMEEFVDDKKNELEDRQNKTISYISQFKYMGIYQNDRQYRQFNTVKFRGLMYLALSDIKGIDPTDVRYWVQIANNGDSANWRGTWTPVATYNLLDMVRYDGSLYICEYTNVDKVPPINEKYWKIVIDNRDKTQSEYYQNFHDVNIILSHNMNRVPLAQVIGVNGYGKGGFGMFGNRHLYNIPCIVEELETGKIKIFVTEELHGVPDIKQVKENEYTIQFPKEQDLIKIRLY